MSDLLELFAPNATWRDGPCAEVRVGDHVIRYVRRGSGPSVVVVRGNGDANPVWRRLIEHLGPNHRIVVTQPPPAGTDVSAWLRGFIEGVGLTSIILVAGGSAAAAAIDVAAADDFTVRKLIVLPPVDSTGGSANDTIDAPELGANVLALSPGSPDESLRCIEQFIAATDAA